MKQLRRILPLLIAITFVITACSDDKSFSAPEIVGTQFTSFGFYAEDNIGILDQDFIVEGYIGSDIHIEMPKEIDKTNLVARFAVSGQSAIVRVNGIVQESKKTANDFTNPIDYIISNGDANNSKYAVTVDKEADSWTKLLPIFSEFAVMESVLKINPVTDVPYVAFIKSGTDPERKPGLVKFEDGKWTQIGDDIAEGRTASIALTFDKTGRPYVGYTDYNATLAQAATVKYYDGNDWVVAGESITDARVTANDMIFDSNDNLMLFSMNNLAGGTLPRRALNISIYNGSSWTINQSVPVRTIAISYLPKAVIKNGIIYLAVDDYSTNSGSTSVYKYSDNTWSVMIEKMRHPDATAVNYYDLDMDVDSKGNVYTIAIETIGGAFKLVIHRYTKATDAWDILATPIDLPSNTRYFSLAVSPADIPYVLYRNNEGSTTSTYIDQETKSWSKPYIMNTEVYNSEKADVEFTSTGIGYAAYANAKGYLVIEKCEPSQD